jgi:EmrB/QacA subfamily drug resistance transporter
MQDAPPRARYQLTFAVLLVSVSTYSLLQSLVLPVLPTIQRGLHTSQNTVTWVLTAYLLAASVATPIVGRIGDMVGKRKVLVITLTTLAAGTLLAALASSIAVMIVARVIQGAGGAIMPLAFGIIRDEFPREKVTSAIGIAAAMLAVGGGAGIVLAGPIVDALNYHWLFWIPLVMIIIAAVATYLLVPESEVRTPGRVSWLAAVLFSGGLVALIVAISEGQLWGWVSVRTTALILVSVVLGVVWVWVELRSEQPLIDMRMMRIPAVWTTNVVSVLFGAGLYASIGFIPQFLQTPTRTGYGFGASVTASGFYLAPQTVTMFVAGMISGRLAARFGAQRVLLVGSLVTVVPFAMLAFAHSQPWEIYTACAVLGFGFGLAFAGMPNIIVSAVPGRQVGVASGMNANIRTIGGSIGAAVMASIITSSVAPDHYPTEAGYTHGFAFLMVAAVFATLACLLIPSARRPVGQPAHVVEHAETAIVAGATLFDADWTAGTLRPPMAP